MKNKIIWLLVLILSFPLAGCSKPKDIMVVDQNNPKAIELNAIAEKYHKENNFFGAVLVAEGGDILLKRGYGLANIAANYKIESNTKFKIASMTKQFTSMCIMMLEEKGLLNVEDTVDKYIPGYPNGNKIKIHNLLNHTSGIAEYLTAIDMYDMDKPYSVQNLIDSFKALDMDFEPGDETAYCNSNYILLGYIIEKVSGMKYEDFINENILRPLKMNDTAYNHNEEGKEYAIGYELIEYPDYILTASKVNMDIPYAAGALHSSIDDLYKWDQALYTEKLIKKQTLEKMFTPNKDQAAYGWFIPENGVAIHGGSIPGFTSYIVRDTNSKSTIIILCNTNSFANMGDMAREFGEKLSLGE